MPATTMKAGLRKPVDLARELGVPPQKVYNLIKHGKVKSHAGGTSVLVDPAEVKAALAAVKPQAERSAAKVEREASGIKPDPSAAKSPLKKGDVVSWGKKGGKTIVQVTGTDEYFAYMKDLAQRDLEFRNTSLEKLLKDGTMQLESPIALIQMGIRALRQADPKIADAVQAGLDKGLHDGFGSKAKPV
jgi:hypothetical protein